jgi:hypothetical protein
MCDFGPRPFLESFDLGLDVRSVLFVVPTSSIQGALRLGDRSLPSLSFLLLGGLFLRVRRARAASRVALRPILEVPRYPPFPCSPLMAFRTTDTVFGHPDAANIWNGRFARPFHIAHYEASDAGSFNSDSTAARMRPRNMIVRLGSGSVRTTRKAHMSEPMFLTLNEVIERYRGQISEGTLRNWRSMRVGPSFLNVGKAVLYPREELDRWDRRSLIVCRPFRPLLIDEVNE